MYTYTAYQLRLHSDIPLPELPPAEGSADVVIRLGTLDELADESLDYRDRIFGKLADVGTFLIEHGRTITLDPDPHVDVNTLHPSILGPAMSVILRQRGLLVLHASSVAIRNQAIAFMGGSGWGKSTLAATFHTQGYDVLTDDVMPIQTDCEQPIVIPAFPQFKLWPEAATSLGHDADRLPPLHANAPKLSYTFSQGFQQTPVPLTRIYVLAKGTHHDIVRLQPQDAFAELVRHTRSAHLLTTPDFAVAHFHQCSRLVQQIPFCRFIRQPSLADLPQLVRLVEADLAEAIA
ncbi:MAG TPA: hypothetical protein V6C78_15570, partial [Crinalium sp.]